MSSVVVDIETIGIDFESLDAKRKEYLLKYGENEEDRKKTKDSLALYPLTGEIVAIGMLNPDTQKGCVLFQNNKGDKINQDEKGILYESGSEKEILEKFWDMMKSYNQIITFNGRGFDAPYLLMRSLVHRVRPTKNILGYRFESNNHCDLLDQLTFYGAVRKYNLDFYAKSFGIKSSKDGGVDGSMVGEMYKNGKYLEIARYCYQDLVTTGEIYNIWNKYLKF